MSSISSSAHDWLNIISRARAQKTQETYASAWGFFQSTLRNHGIDPEKTDVKELNEKAFAWLLSDLKSLSTASEQIYLTGIKQFYKYLISEGRTDINIVLIGSLIEQRARRPGIRYPQFNTEEILRVIQGIESLPMDAADKSQRLRNLRDKAFILTLADTGLRIHEACKLRRGDMDWNEAKVTIIGKGNKQDIVRFSRRSLNAIRDYLQARAGLDGASGKPLSSLPLFTRHDPGAGKKILPITTVTGRCMIEERVTQIIGKTESRKITPHSFRHYFVSGVVRSSNNLKLAQELARHANIQMTQRYAHLSDEELDKGYYEAVEKGKS